MEQPCSFQILFQSHWQYLWKLALIGGEPGLSGRQCGWRAVTYVERNYAREVRPISFVRRRFDPGKVPQKHSFPLERIVGQQSAIKCSEVGFQCSVVLCGVHIVERSAKTLDTPGNPTHTSKARGRVTVMERMNLQVQEFVSFLWFFNLFSPD